MAKQRKRGPGGRPALPPERRRVVLSVRVAPVVLEALDTYVATWEIDRAEAIEEAIMVLTRKSKAGRDFLDEMVGELDATGRRAFRAAVARKRKA